MALDSSVGTLTSDSYISLTEANDYHLARLHNDEWTDATVSEREKALKWATRLLDNLPWLGAAVDYPDNQALRWPRYDVPDREADYWDHDIIPQFLKDATAELAWLLVISDPTRENDTKGFHMIKVGPITLQINSDDRSKAIYDSVMKMVNPFIHHTVMMMRG